MRRKTVNLKILVFLLLCSMPFIAEAEDPKFYTEEVIIENLWDSNHLNLARRIEKSMYEEGFAVLVPTDLLVSKDRLFIFNPHGESIMEIDEKGNLQRVYETKGSYTQGVGFKHGSLYYRTVNQVKELMIETDAVNDLIGIKSVELIGYDQNEDWFYTVDYLFRHIIVYHYNKKIAEIDVNEILKENKFPRLSGRRRYIKGNNIFFPREWKSVEAVSNQELICKNEEYTPSIIVLDINSGKVKEVKVKNQDFGYYIIGQDKEGRIYSTSNYCVNRIFIHDRHGGFIMEIKPDYTKYGVPEGGFEEGLMHPVYVTDAGDIFIMMRMREGIFIVKYIPLFK